MASIDLDAGDKYIDGSETGERWKGSRELAGKLWGLNGRVE